MFFFFQWFRSDLVLTCKYQYLFQRVRLDLYCIFPIELKCKEV
jgi:hypothetical protein